MPSPQTLADANPANAIHGDNADKNNLLGLTRTELRTFASKLGAKPYRGDQLCQWIYQRGVTDFEQMTDLSKSFRHRLQDNACVVAPRCEKTYRSQDGCQKWLLNTAKGIIETVLIPATGRQTLCISSQAGCTLDCVFCATGKQGFQGNLTPSEVIGQLWYAEQQMAATHRPERLAISNVVFMGMGEPLLNLDNVLPALSLMNDDFAYGLSTRRVTVSTAGVVPGIEHLASRSKASLAVSLHAPTDDLRDQLVPLNKKYPIASLMKACRYYLEALPGRARHITFEYILLAGVNDHPSQAKDLLRLLAPMRCKVNLIPYNPVPNLPFCRPSQTSILAFRDILHHGGCRVTVRSQRGADISAACGQLAGSIKQHTRRGKMPASKAFDASIISVSELG